MLFTPSGIVIVLRGVSSNALSPIVSSWPESVAYARVLHPSNAEFPMDETLSGKVIAVRPLPEKALSPMEASPFGSVMEVSAVQPSNACAPIFVTEAGITRFLIGE